MLLEKYSIRIGDRFCRQGKAQLAALIKAKQQGVNNGQTGRFEGIANWIGLASGR